MNINFIKQLEDNIIIFYKSKKMTQKMQQIDDIFFESEYSDDQQNDYSILQSQIENQEQQSEEQNINQTQTQTQTQSFEVKHPKSQQKVEKTSKKASSTNRINNNIIPNLVRLIKNHLNLSIPQPNRKITWQILDGLFQKFAIKKQVWAIQAILVFLLYLRDKTQHLSPEAYSQTIQKLILVFQESKNNLVMINSLNLRKKELIQKNYAACIKYFKVYDQQNQTFDGLNKSVQQTREEFFRKMVAKKQGLIPLFLVKIKEIQKYLSQECFVGKSVYKNTKTKIN